MILKKENTLMEYKYLLLCSSVSPFCGSPIDLYHSNSPHPKFSSYMYQISIAKIGWTLEDFVPLKRSKKDIKNVDHI